MHANTAGAPLPLIPRRTSSSRVSATPSTPRPTYPIKITVQYPSPPNERKPQQQSIAFPNDSDSSSSSSDGTRPTIAPRAKRIRGQRMAMALTAETPAIRAAEQSTSTPERFALISTSTNNSNPKSRGRNENIHALKSAQEDSAFHPRATRSSSLAPSSSNHAYDEQPRLVRKKSGQPVKSSLKSSKSFIRGSLSVVMSPSVHGSKSEPSTPTKAVHFDSQLEHVKLFLAEQKPLAVSRDGSPTEDTSGTDTDFPSFIYGRGDSDGKVLSMNLLNMPAARPIGDAVLESMSLSADKTSIAGSIRVRNLAFHKWIAVRFTFDAWQTTSEVTAKYVESFDDNRFDRFSFVVRLNDLLARIEGKQLVLAARYVVDGREIWDNNDGRNYLASFTKTVPERPKSDDEDSSSTIGADLKTKLERVVAQNTSKNGGSFPLRSPSSSTATFQTGASLASRYDFGTSLKSNWKPNDAPSPPRHFRANSHPVLNRNGVSSPVISPSSSSSSAFSTIPILSPAPSSSIPWPSQKRTSPLGSPRDKDQHNEDVFITSPSVYRSLEDEETRSFTPPEDASRSRNHTRGYFDFGLTVPTPMSDASLVRRTPPGTPRFNSFPPMSPGAGVVLAVQEGDFAKALEMKREQEMRKVDLDLIPGGISRVSSGSSDLSVSLTPSSIFSPVSSRSSSPSSASGGEEVVVGQVGVDPSTDYHEFLDKFCFFTGSASLEIPLDELPRSQSASSVEEFLATKVNVGHDGNALMRPVRSASAEDVNMRSGSGGSTPRAATPVHV